jgi:hypothetical protein
MNEAGRKHRSSPAHDVPSRLRLDLDRLAAKESELTLSLETVLADEHFNPKQFAQLLEERSSAAQQQFSLILKWMDQLDRRVSKVESRLADLASQASDQGEAFRMMCSVLKEIEDPYGFGVSLDERILGDAGHLTTDDQED